MTLLSRLRYWTSPACAVPRLRVCYYATTAALGLTLLAAHRLVLCEHREAALLRTADTACQLSAALPFIFIRVPPAPVRAVVTPNTRRATAAHEE